MRRWFWLWFGLLVRVFRLRRSLLLENLALRQQLTVLKRKHPKPKLPVLDKLFWVLARRCWSAWKQSLIVVTPETLVRWHRAGFRLYWTLISKVRSRVGRRRVSKEVRDLIFRMVAEKSHLGRSPHSWRTSDVGLRCIGAKHLPLDEASSQGSRSGSAVVGFSAQSPRSHRGHGFLHRSDGHLQSPRLLLRYWPRPQAHLALQRHAPSDQRLDCAAAAGSVSL